MPFLSFSIRFRWKIKTLGEVEHKEEKIKDIFVVDGDGGVLR
jgi:hypothetical protein